MLNQNVGVFGDFNIISQIQGSDQDNNGEFNAGNALGLGQDGGDSNSDQQGSESSEENSSEESSDVSVEEVQNN